MSYSKIIAIFLLFSSNSYAITVSFLHSPFCSHCHEMMPEWEKVIDAFNETQDIVMLTVDVTTSEGKMLSQSLGNKYVPSVYIEDTLVNQGSRSDFYEYISGKICDELEGEPIACAGKTQKKSSAAYVAVPAILIIGIIAYKKGRPNL